VIEYRVAGRRNYNQDCPIANGLDVLGERWTLLIVRELVGGPRRYSDLRAQLPARVALSSGHVFGNGGAGHVRLNFATSQAIWSRCIANGSGARQLLSRANPLGSY
jgi:HxlR-like helix-turn-helix